MKNQGSSRTLQREKAALLKAQVMALLNWSEMQYAELQFSQGVEYLKTYLKGNEHDMRLLEYSSVFWAWWRNHWTQRDENFMAIHHAHPLRRVDIARQLYEQYNRGRLLANSIHPNAVVLNESYALMIDELIQTETQPV